MVSAADVKALRERTGLAMMACKKALTEADGDIDKAIRLLRERGAVKAVERAGRETAFGRFGLYCGVEKPAGGIVELKCESAPVTQNEEFITLANDLARALAENADIETAEQLLAKPSPSKDGQTLGDQKDELFNRMGEVFNVGRIARFEGPTGGYSHNSGTVAGVLISIEGGNDEAAKDVSMHIAAMRPKVSTTEELDANEVQQEREILRAAALQEGKPENIVDKMVEGRLRSFYAANVLHEQPYVKDDKQTVGQYAKANDMKIKKFVHWELGQAEG